jgi:hypothetical protein
MSRAGRPIPIDSSFPKTPVAGERAAEVVEHSPDTGWELWTRVEQSLDVPFPPTAPASLPASLRPDDPAYGATGPAHLAADLAHRTDGRDMLDDALEEARWRNRVCLRAEKWRHMFEILTARAGSTGGMPPPQPILGAAWNSTPAIPKRLRFQEQLMWANQHDVLVPVLAYMRSLPETDWLHMGE